MPRRIDHVILASRDLDTLEPIFIRLGFSVTGGGTHPHLGTRNRIVVLGEGYLELLGVANAERVSPVVTRRLSRARTGWVGFAVQSDDIVSEAAAMRSRGVDARGPQPGRLVAPNGRTRSWSVTMIGSDDLWSAAEPLPFLIQHDAVGGRHRQELAGEGVLEPHANGALRLSAVYVAVHDLDAAVESFARAYNLRVVGSPRYDDVLKAETVTLPLAEGDERIVLAQATASGPVRTRLDEAGDGVCAVSVAVAARAAAESLLRSRGMRYSVAGDDLWLEEFSQLGCPLAFASEQ